MKGEQRGLAKRGGLLFKISYHSNGRRTGGRFISTIRSPVSRGHGKSWLVRKERGERIRGNGPGEKKPKKTEKTDNPSQ